jgi:hypothetical protein
MDDLQREIERATLQIQQAAEVLKTALQRRIDAKKVGLQRKSLDESVTTAKEAFTAAEVRLRALYEAKGDWVPLSQVARAPASPAPIASSANAPSR